jgi:Chaperone of endosialidase
MKNILYTSRMLFTLLIAGMLVAATPTSYAQGVVVGSNIPAHPSAMLDCNDDSKGVLLTDLWLTNANNASPVNNPANGLLTFAYLAYDGIGFYYWENNQWKKIQNGTGLFWRNLGNTDIDMATNGIGTNDNVDLVFKRNNVKAGLIGATNTAFGNASLSSASLSGIYNTAYGASALMKNTTGSYNSAFGARSLQENTVGSYNSAAGFDAMTFNVTGDSNVAVGRASLYLNSNGSRNTAIGTLAMQNFNNGTKNTAVGYGASVASGLNYATAIGANSYVSVSNAMALGGQGQWAVRVGINYPPDADLRMNDRGVNDSAGIRLVHSGGVNNWRFAEVSGALNFYKNGVLKGHLSSGTGEYIKDSDKRLKSGIQPLINILPKVLLLQPKTYHYTDNEANAPLSYGLIAQEVEALFPSMVSTKPDTGIKAINYEQVGVVAIQAAREQQVQLDKQMERLVSLQQRLEALEKNISERK